jgi:hypothetical protein
LNGCARCRRDFASLKAFDQHFERGEHFGCGDLEHDARWMTDRRGRWTTVELAEKAEQTREHFADSLSDVSQTV